MLITTKKIVILKINRYFCQKYRDDKTTQFDAY